MQMSLTCIRHSLTVIKYASQLSQKLMPQISKNLITINFLKSHLNLCRMSGYHGSDEDEFSPKKYATVSAIKDAFKYAGHVHDGSEEDVLYHQKMYGRDDEKNEFGSDYMRRDKQEDLDKKQKDELGLKEETIVDRLGQLYKPSSNDEVAKTLFGSQTMDVGRTEQDLHSQTDEPSGVKKQVKGEEIAENLPEHNEHPEGNPERKIAEMFKAGRNKKSHDKKSVEEILEGIPWKAKRK